MNRMNRKDAIRAVSEAQRGTLDGLADLLSWELHEAYAEMESAKDNIAIWRAQGRAVEIRNLIVILKLKGMIENE